jgi:hypothetical protein
LEAVNSNQGRLAGHVEDPGLQAQHRVAFGEQGAERLQHPRAVLGVHQLEDARTL